jgi:rRNA maturation endonuclease Nob1
MNHEVRCFECERVVSDPYLDECPTCHGKLYVKMDLEGIKEASPQEFASRPLGVWR